MHPVICVGLPKVESRGKLRIYLGVIFYVVDYLVEINERSNDERIFVKCRSARKNIIWTYLLKPYSIKRSITCKSICT